MSTPRTGAASAILDGRLYVVGGRGPGGALLATAEVFNATTGAWAPIASLAEGRTDARLLALEGRLYLLGGRDAGDATDDVEVYRPDLDRWDEGDRDLDRSREGLAAGVVGSDLFVLGGVDDNGTFLSTTETLLGDRWEIYAPWTLAPARARAGSSSTGDAIVLAGGFSQFGPLDIVERYAPGAAPTPLPALPTARGGLALVVSDDHLLALGGRDASDTPLTAVDRLAPGTDVWTPLTPLPEPREGAAAAVLGNDLYVAGGTGAFDSILASVVRLPGAGVAGEGGPAPPALTLAIEGPNPARGSVRVVLTLPTSSDTRVTVVDALGRAVTTLAAGGLTAGRHALVWNAHGHAGGVYVVRAEAGAGAAARRVTLVR